jgi:aminoglycoside 3-N-acetyltransferase
VIAASQIVEALRAAGVRSGDALYVHAGLQGALRVEGAGREEKMDTVLTALSDAVGEGCLMMPTFTYSFCRDEPFDTAASPSTVGMLTERFRAREDVRRIPDPIFSSAVAGQLADGWDERLFAVGDVDCFGEESVFAHLYAADARLLFFGVGFEFCTFVHLVEQRHGVPYRYLKPFTGEVISDGTSVQATARYYVRDLEQKVESDFAPLGRLLLERGHAREVQIPRGPRVLAVPARAVHDVALEQLRRNPDFLLTRGHA